MAQDKGQKRRTNLSRANMALLRRSGFGHSPSYELTSGRLDELLNAARKEGSWAAVGSGLKFLVSPAAWVRRLKPREAWEPEPEKPAAPVAPEAAVQRETAAPPANDAQRLYARSPQEAEAEDQLRAQVRDIFSGKNQGAPPADR
jgi:hypothetical protein